MDQGSAPPDIRVAIVEDNDAIREGLAVLINGSPGFSSVGAFGDAESALRSFPTIKAHVVLMDIQLPGMSGIECVRRLRKENNDALVMMLSVYDDDDRVFQSIVAGASGYILKKVPPAELLEAIRQMVNGGSPMSDRIARKVVNAFRTLGAAPQETENLTPREQEILSHLAKGFHSKEIAQRLFLSVDTVSTHLRNIYRKLQVRSRTEAVLKYLNKT